MPITIGCFLDDCKKPLQAQDTIQKAILNRSNSDFYNLIRHHNPCSYITIKISSINMHQTSIHKDCDRDALKRSIKLYLSDYQSAEQAENLVEEHIP